MWLVMVEGRSVHVFLVGKPDSKRGLGDWDIRWRIIFKWI
jgi:hypothetical protein